MSCQHSHIGPACEICFSNVSQEHVAECNRGLHYPWQALPFTMWTFNNNSGPAYREKIPDAPILTAHSECYYQKYGSRWPNGVVASSIYNTLKNK